ncbi:hypothetical protein [Photobacterium kishitanii]|uniref:Uncharacterized protein n=1 Tax=Photobacterium kishitanii TaxID=318456 RepID=A0A2T3KKX4_9GAMM|nr:hypothetical protein [Photobacterium kishitanii]PSV00368.1 hypothetical protein C9J27_04370 [Photobacterium kishitanii]
MFSFFKKFFHEQNTNPQQKQITPPAISYDVFWGDFVKHYESAAPSNPELPKLNHDSKMTIREILNPVFEADSLIAQKVELRKIGRTIISRRAYVTAYCDNIQQVSSLAQYLNILKSVNVELSIKTEMELISASKELAQWFPVVLCAALALKDYRSDGWLHCYTILYEFHARQLIEHGQVFQYISDDNAIQEEPTTKQCLSLSNIILLEKFMDMFHQKIMTGDASTYNFQKLIDSLINEEYLHL